MWDINSETFLTKVRKRDGTTEKGQKDVLLLTLKTEEGQELRKVSGA